jgi:hypothetical protein
LKHGVSEIVRRSDVQQSHCTHLASAAALPMVSRFAFAQAYAWILVQLASILLLVLVWCSSSRADEYASVPHNVIESRASTTVENQGIERAREKRPQSLILSRLMPAQNDHEEQRAIQSSEPLLEALTEDISAKWADLQARIQLEQEALAACRAGSTNCPAAARRFLHIVELGRQRQGRARLAEINRAVNFSIRPVSDWAQYGVADFWSAPLATLNAGKGDCEDLRGSSRSRDRPRECASFTCILSQTQDKSCRSRCPCR